MHLDFFPELGAAYKAASAEKVVPVAYRGNDGPIQPLFHAFRLLRNGAAHSGVSGDGDCQEAISVFRPWLDTLLTQFRFLADYELLVLAGPVTSSRTPQASASCAGRLCRSRRRRP